jgi:hypothetical protein
VGNVELRVECGDLSPLLDFGIAVFLSFLKQRRVAAALQSELAGAEGKTPESLTFSDISSENSGKPGANLPRLVPKSASRLSPGLPGWVGTLFLVLRSVPCCSTRCKNFPYARRGQRRRRTHE